VTALALIAALLLAAPASPPPSSSPPPPASPLDVAPAPAASSPRERFDRARALLEAGDLLGAAAELDAVASDPAAAPSLAEAARVLADTSRSWAARGRFVLREPLSRTRIDRSGRAELAFFSTVYGIWALDALGVVTEVEDPRGYVALSIAGGAAGLATALLSTRDSSMTSGRAASFWSSTAWASFHGGMIASLADATGREAIGATLATSAAAVAGTAVLTRGRNPSAGDVSLVNSGGLWTMAAGGLVLTFLPEPGDRTIKWTLLGAADAGLLAAALLAQRVEISRGHMLLIDAGGILGTLTGLAIPLFLESETAEAYGAAGLVGMAAGLGTAAWLSRGWDDDAPGTAAGARLAPMLTRLADGTAMAGVAGRF
jgi:hypothetical protein